MRYPYLALGFLLIVTGSAKGDQFCFALAETYYEQVYCQLQAKAQTKNLPAFNQFKKNNEQVQASLLKRLAERNGIKLPRPANHLSVAIATRPVVGKPTLAAKTIATESPASIQPNKLSQISVSGCDLLAKQLRCANGVFTLRGNQANQRLAKTALSAKNSMALPAYKSGETNQYLTRAYQQYIFKMCEIGLCGVTMTYGKFAYLYQDISSKGLDFTQRFETMYGFLKKDKASMGISESISVPPGLVAGECSPLGETYYVCEKQGRNFIFVRQ